MSKTRFQLGANKKTDALIHELRWLSAMSLSFPVDAKLKDGSPVQLVLGDQQDIEPLRRLFRVIVEEGMYYPHDRFDRSVGFADHSRVR